MSICGWLLCGSNHRPRTYEKILSFIRPFFSVLQSSKNGVALWANTYAKSLKYTLSFSPHRLVRNIIRNTKISITITIKNIM